jgi:hypothetical protein
VDHGVCVDLVPRTLGQTFKVEVDLAGKYPDNVAGADDRFEFGKFFAASKAIANNGKITVERGILSFRPFFRPDHFLNRAKRDLEFLAVRRRGAEHVFDGNERHFPSLVCSAKI